MNVKRFAFEWYSINQTCRYVLNTVLFLRNGLYIELKDKNLPNKNVIRNEFERKMVNFVLFMDLSTMK